MFRLRSHCDRNVIMDHGAHPIAICICTTDFQITINDSCNGFVITLRCDRDIMTVDYWLLAGSPQSTDHSPYLIAFSPLSVCSGKVSSIYSVLNYCNSRSYSVSHALCHLQHCYQHITTNHSPRTYYLLPANRSLIA